MFDETRYIERLQFFDGQQLFATDLQGIEQFNREMRWLHNRSLHQPGIGNGYAPYGKKGDREVVIGPGYAIDLLGQEIVLTRQETLPVPPVASDDGQSVLFDLVVMYPDDAALEVAETREGVYVPRGVTRLREAPVFCWARLTRQANGNPVTMRARLKSLIEQGRALVVVRVEVLNCQLYKDLSDIALAQRRNARPARDPRIACGSSRPEWKPWVISNATTPPTTFLGLTADINTSEAGFQIEPHYIARIEGDRPITIITEPTIPLSDPTPRLGYSSRRASRRPIQQADESQQTIHVFDGPLYIDKIDKTNLSNFTVHVVLHDQSGNLVSLINPDVFKNWSIVWVGVEG